MAEAAHELVLCGLHVTVEIGEMHNPGEIGFVKLDPPLMLEGIALALVAHESRGPAAAQARPASSRKPSFMAVTL